MLLRNDRGESFELHIVGYEFPGCDSGWDSDANYLKINYSAETATRICREEADACLRTSDVEWTAMWLENLADDVFQDDYMDFEEPNLAFRRIGSAQGTMGLRVFVDSNTGEGLTLEFEFSKEQLVEAAASLREELARFPPRAGYEKRRPFVAPKLAEQIVLEWTQFVPRKTRGACERRVRDFCRELDLMPQILEYGSLKRSDGYSYVVFRTALPVSGREPLQALWHFAASFPGWLNLPNIGRPDLAPDGLFSCYGQVSFLETGHFGHAEHNPEFAGMLAFFTMTNAKAGSSLHLSLDWISAALPPAAKYHDIKGIQGSSMIGE